MSRVARYIRHLVARTRVSPDLELGASPRGAILLFHAAQARAFLAGREYVSPDDVQRQALAVLAHRVRANPQARYSGKTEAAIVAEVLETTDVPT